MRVERMNLCDCLIDVSKSTLFRRLVQWNFGQKTCLEGENNGFIIFHLEKSAAQELLSVETIFV